MPDKICPECGHPMQLDANYDPAVWKCTNWDCGFEQESDEDDI